MWHHRSFDLGACMSFPRIQTKRLSALPHKDTCCCGDCPYEQVLLDRVDWMRVLQERMWRDEVTVLVHGKFRKVKSIETVGEHKERISVVFESCGCEEGDEDTFLTYPETMVLKVSGVTK